MSLRFAAFAAGLAIWGLHARLPWRLARAAPNEELESRRRWGLYCLPLLLLATLLLVWSAGAAPDAALRLGFAGSFPASPLARWLLILFAAAGLADLLVALGWRRLESGGWRLVGVFGGAGLAAFGLLGTLLSLPPAQEPDWTPLLFSVACRTLVALGATECILPGRPRVAFAAGLALLTDPLFLTPALRAALVSGGDLLTLGAGALLFMIVRWLPVRLHRPTLAAATLFAAVWFARITELAPSLPMSLFPN